MKRLLIETRMNSLALNESKSRQVHPGCLGTLDGPCADLKKATRNGNFYSRKLWENVFNDPIVKESLEDRILIGELDHPGDRLETKAVNAAIVMTDYEFRDDEGLLYGTFDILDTPNGRILKSLLDYGCKIGVSSRGEGDVTANDEGVDVVDEESYSFMGFDAVVLPAVKAAKPSLRESLDRKSMTLKESLMKQVQESTTIAELNLIKSVVEAADLPDSDSLLESVNNKSQEIEGTTGSSNLLEDLEKASGQISNLTSEINKLKEELTTCKSRMSKLMKSKIKVVDDLRQSNRKLKDLNQKYSCSVFDLSESAKRSEGLESQIKGCKSKIDKLESIKKSLERQVSKLEESLSSSQDALRKKSEEASKLKIQVESLKKTSSQKLTESKSRTDKVSQDLKESKNLAEKARRGLKSFTESYVKDYCDSHGLSYDSVKNFLKEGMTKSEVDTLLESKLNESDRYKKLPFRTDPLIDSATIQFDSKSLSVDEDQIRTNDFMSEVNKLF